MKKSKAIIILLLIFAIVFAVLNADEISKKLFYPIKYAEYVEKYSAENNIDKYLVYAIIKTESGFDENAVSSVGARGLMQIMNDAFEWVKFRMKDESEISYEDMFSAQYNIQYGSYLYSLLHEEYGDVETALVAYFSGRGQVNEWLKNSEYSENGKTLSVIPTKASAHYVYKVMKAFESYQNLYEN